MRRMASPWYISLGCSIGMEGTEWVIGVLLGVLSLLHCSVLLLLYEEESCYRAMFGAFSLRGARSPRYRVSTDGAWRLSSTHIGMWGLQCDLTLRRLRLSQNILFIRRMSPLSRSLPCVFRRPLLSRSGWECRCWQGTMVSQRLMSGGSPGLDPRPDGDNVLSFISGVFLALLLKAEQMVGTLLI